MFIGLALFVGAIAFNLQMNSSNNETSDLTLKNIKAITASAEEDDEDDILYGHYCARYYVNDPVMGPSYCWECRPGAESDKCDPSTCKGCMTA